MHWYEPLIIIAAVSFVGLVIFLDFYLKKKGKSLGGDCGCNGNCKKCGHQCSSANKKLLEVYHQTYSKK